MSNTQDNAVKPSKPKKKKGPIRVEAIVPFGVIIALLALYFTLFFDRNLRSAIEWVGTEANGAEVDVGWLKTSFLKGTFAMGDIEVTKKAEPEKNAVQVGNVHFGFLWDALLRAKFVVTTAGITDIQVNTPRKHPGRVLPPEPEGMASKLFRSESHKLIAAARDEIKQSSLGDIGKLLEGFDPSKELKDLGNLKTLAQIEKLSADLGAKEKEWNAAIASMPSDKDFDSMRTRVTSIPTSGGSPQEIAGRVQQVKGLITEIGSKVKDTQTKAGALTGGVGQFTSSLGSIDQTLAEDRKAIEGKLKLPSLDPKDMAKDFFGKTVLEDAGQYDKYVELAREYMPEKKKADPKAAKPVEHARDKGKTYTFGRPNSYPLFWLQHADVSSKGEAGFGGTIQGELKNFTTNPEFLGHPATVALRGDFPGQNITGFSLDAVFDHAREPARDTFKAVVKSFPVGGRTLSKSDTLEFGFAKAIGRAEMQGAYESGRLTFELASAFHEVDYKIQAQSKMLAETLQGVVKGIPQVTLGAKISAGGGQPLAMAIESNLATELARGFQKHLQEKLGEARKKIDGMLHAQVDEKKKALTQKADAVKTQVLAQAESRKKQAEALQAQATAKLAELQNVGNQAKNKGIDAVKGKFKKPF